MTGPRLSDPGSSPRFPKRGEARREMPIYSREQFGPWKCDVHVTPITGMRRGYPVFEVRCAWEHGPALDDSLGPAPPTGMAGVDVFYVDRQAPDLQLTATQASDLAIELARRATHALHSGYKPDLPALSRAIVRRIRL
jgi:hypothetical protein